MLSDYKRTIISEGGYAVVFSNDGDKPKENPNPTNYRREKIKCLVEGCDRFTTDPYGLCTRHRRMWPNFNLRYRKDWVGRIVPQDAQHSAIKPPSHATMTEPLLEWAGKDPHKLERLDTFIRMLLDDEELGVVGRIPDADALQDKVENGESGYETPDWVADRVRRLIDLSFPENEFGDIYVIVRWNYFIVRKLPIRIVAATLAIGFACEEANRSDAWFMARYAPQMKRQRASAYMSSVYYFLRRYTKALPEQAKKASGGR